MPHEFRDMPDETPARAADDGLTLSVQVEGTGRDEPARLYVIGRPHEGRVRLREWRGDDWSAGPLERDVLATDLYAEIARAHDARRRVSEELYRIRLWLEGTVV